MLILSWIYTGFVWIYTALSFFIHATLIFLLRRWMKHPEEFAIRLSYPFSELGFWLFRFQVRTLGRENLPEGPCILVCNHQSLIDIVVVLCGTRKIISFIAKKELLEVPLLGWDMKAQGHIPIDRSDSRGSVKELKKVEEKIRNGTSLILFPEGTRTTDGTIGPFKKGAFMMAVHTGVPIVPCCISGGHTILNKNSWRVSPGNITFQIGKPIPVEHCEDPALAKATAVALMNHTRNLIIDMQKALV